MGKIRRAKYSKQEIKDASRTVMKSLNMINKQSVKFTPQISNSLGAPTKGQSKSALRRQNRKKRANLGGKDMETLFGALEQVEEKVKQEKPLNHPLDPHANQKSNKRVFDTEVSQHQKTVGLSLDEIKRRLQQNIQ